MAPGFPSDEVHLVHAAANGSIAPGATLNSIPLYAEHSPIGEAIWTALLTLPAAPNDQHPVPASVPAHVIAPISRVSPDATYPFSGSADPQQTQERMTQHLFADSLPNGSNPTSIGISLNDQEILLQSILRSLTEHIAVLDRNGTIIAVNEAWEQFALENGVTTLQRVGVGVNYLEVCEQASGRFSEGATDTAAGIRAVLQQKSMHFSSEYACPTPQEERWFLLHVTPLPDTPGGAVVAHIDITERKRAEQQRLVWERKLMEAQKLESLGILAGGIAHDFNNLLASILGSAELALLDLAPDAPAYTSVKHIELATRRAAEMTRQMLAFASKRQILVQPIDLNALVKEMSRLLTASVIRHVQIQTHFAPDLPLIEADATQIRQVVMNLMMNAAEALERGNGRLTMTTGRRYVDQHYLATTRMLPEAGEGEYVYLEVTDTGQGMDQTTLARIFDPFFTTKQTGHGLGLPAVLAIVRGHKGTVKVESHVGQGTTFTVMFPCTPSVACTGPEEQPVQALPEGTNTILLIEDEESVCTVIKRMLERLGFTVLAATDGLAGLELFRNYVHTITCVLVDLSVPHLDGAQLLPEIRRIRPGMPVVLMSGYTEEEVAGRFTDSTPPILLSKPFTSHTLREKIRQAMMQ